MGEEAATMRSERIGGGDDIRGKTREGVEKKRKLEKKKMAGPTFLDGDLETLQEWRLGGGIWRSMENICPFRDPDGVEFFIKSSNFGVKKFVLPP
jgi:hypothetical protein